MKLNILSLAVVIAPLLTITFTFDAEPSGFRPWTNNIWSGNGNLWASFNANMKLPQMNMNTRPIAMQWPQVNLQAGSAFSFRESPRQDTANTNMNVRVRWGFLNP